MTGDATPPPPPRVRPNVPALATLLTVFVGVGMLAATCVGGVALSMAKRA
jgi:hypothetical protein